MGRKGAPAKWVLFIDVPGRPGETRTLPAGTLGAGIEAGGQGWAYVLLMDNSPGEGQPGR